jgi:hypothetical protein
VLYIVYRKFKERDMTPYAQAEIKGMLVNPFIGLVLMLNLGIFHTLKQQMILYNWRDFYSEEFIREKIFEKYREED